MKNSVKILICSAILTLPASTALAGKGKSFKSMGRSISGGKSFARAKTFSGPKFSSGSKTLSPTKSFNRMTSNTLSPSRNLSNATRNFNNISKSHLKSNLGRVNRQVSTVPKIVRSNVNIKTRGGLGKAISAVQPKISTQLKNQGITRQNFGIKQLGQNGVKEVIGKVLGKKLDANPNLRPQLDSPLTKNRVEDAIKDLVGNGLVRPSIPNNSGHENDQEHKHKHWLNPPLRTICLPPIVRCPAPTVCPPSVLAVCPGAECVVVERTTEQVLTEFLEEPAPAEPTFILDLESNAKVSLEIDGLTRTPGALVLEINEIGLPVEVLLFENGVLDVRVPSVGLGEAKLGKLYVLNADLQLIAAVDARLHPGAAAQ